MIINEILTKRASNEVWSESFNTAWQNKGTIIIILLVFDFLLLLSLFAYIYFNESEILLISAAIALLGGYYFYSQLDIILSSIADFNRFFEIEKLDFNFVYSADSTLGDFIVNNPFRIVTLLITVIIVVVLLIKFVELFTEVKPGVR